MSDPLIFEVDGSIATITLNRPEKLNSLSTEMLDRWIAVLEECRASDSIRAIVMTATGRAFSTGGDRDRFDDQQSKSPADMKRGLQEGIQRLPRKILEVDKPMIAAINGMALGAGLDIALMCDIRFAARSAQFAEVYAQVGLVPGAGGAWLLPRAVGMAKALEMLWTCDRIDAETAQRIGLVNGVFPDDELMARTYEVAQRIAAKPPLAIRAIKRLAHQAWGSDLPNALEAVATAMPIVRSSADHREAVAGARDKRAPVFIGR